MDHKQEQFLRMQQYQYAPKMPFYMSYPVQNIYMTEMEYERDMERMKELYPEEAKQIQKLVEEECDKMEYEGSMMFDEYPDRVMLKVICDRIYQNASGANIASAADITNADNAVNTMDTADTTDKIEAVEGMGFEDGNVSQQNFWQGPGRPPGHGGSSSPGRPPGPPPPGRPPGPPGPPPRPQPPRNPGLNTLIEVLLYNEMYKRRCRHNRCRRWW